MLEENKLPVEDTQEEAPEQEVDEAVEDSSPNDEDQSTEKAENDEWAAIYKELHPQRDDLGGEGAKTEEKAPVEDEPGKQEENKAPEAPQEAPEQPRYTPDTAAINARMTARQMAEEVNTVKAEVHSKLFANLPTTPVDNQGNPIRSAEELMQFENPRTPGEAFTREEAAIVYQQMSQEVAASRQTAEDYSTKVADVNVRLKDEAEMVMAKYGDMVNPDSDLGARLFAEYQKTVITDPQTGLILDAPVSLASFYESALAPQAEALKASQELESAKAEIAKMKEEAEKQLAEAKKLQSRSDRSDIYASSSDTKMSKDEKEWSDIAKEYYSS